MHRLRSAASLARFVLAWFALCVAVAVAAPLVQPRSVQLVCTGGALKLLQQGDDDAPASAPTLDCALCTPAVVPPPAVASVPLLEQVAAAPSVPAPPALRVAELQCPPARGPPQRASVT